MNFANFTRLLVTLSFLLLTLTVYCNCDELENEANDSQLPVNATNITSNIVPSSIVHVFKRNLNCITRIVGNRYRRICRKGPQQPPARFANNFSPGAGYAKPAGSPFAFPSNDNFHEFPYQNGYQRRNKYGNRWTHNNLRYFPRDHKRRRGPWFPTRTSVRPYPKPKRPTTANLSEQPNKEYCGMRSYDPLGGRIVGGRAAESGEFPWQVGIQEDEGDNNFQIRGGAVILSKRWILTAAHVFTGKDSAKDYRGVVGTTDLNGNARYLKFDKLIKHNKWADEPGEFDNDIALLHTTEDIPLFPSDQNINNICLPDVNENFKGSVTVTGWGKTSDQGFETNQLMTVSIQVLDNQICEKNFKHHFKKAIMICAGNVRGGKDSCSGDSGGPLIKLKNKQWYLAGIVSFGGHNKCARKGTGASYTKVSKYVTWILNHMKE